ncbi:MFS transporter [Ktedonosporobacter rubrisoli]|uniref:MFS transporter n=1 Tax=Ktedonosporobacter rubrisoli TaxID=2509675 RepID=A0A4P6JPE3_KTERU|nr:sugar porter family MFS transporter [Ktedonosporobacter rubrisoli]QBD76942.1 MFS transporter [Ktedonosporobacter rubrisoli]
MSHAATNISHIPRPHRSSLVAITAAIIGVIYGYDLGNISGALLFIPAQLHLGTFQVESVTTVVVVGEIVGALLGGPLANAIGRKLVMVIVAFSYAVFAILSALAMSLLWLDVTRFLLGITIGLSIVVTPIFVAESVPARVRGRLVVMYQLATVAGIMIAYFIDYALAFGAQWRLMLGLAALPAIIVGFLLLPLPDTPRWYLMKGRREQAREALQQIESEAMVEKEMSDFEVGIRSERGGRVIDMLRPPYLRATIFVVILGFLVQITGINAVVFYSPLIFKAMGFQGNFALLILPGIVQVASFIATIGSLFIVDRLGRRPTLLTGIGVMILAGILMAVVFSFGAFNGALSTLGFVGILFFTAAFNFGFGSMVWVYASESFPARLRTLGSSTMLTADLVANVIIASFFLSALTSFGGMATFIVLVIFAVIAWLFVWWLAPETKGRPLEDIRLYWENGARWLDERQEG